MNLMAMQIEENRRKVKMTILRREGGMTSRFQGSLTDW